MSDYITPATQEQIARQVADAKKLNGNASLWDIENRRAVRTLANDRDRLTKHVRILWEALADNLQAWEGEEESVREEHADLIEKTRAALEATKEGA